MDYGVNSKIVKFYLIIIYLQTHLPVTELFIIAPFKSRTYCQNM